MAKTHIHTKKLNNSLTFCKQKWGTSQPPFVLPCFYPLKRCFSVISYAPALANVLSEAHYKIVEGKLFKLAEAFRCPN